MEVRRVVGRGVWYGKTYSAKAVYICLCSAWAVVPVLRKCTFRRGFWVQM